MHLGLYPSLSLPTDSAEEPEKLTHVLWHCQYHIVWVPKYRYRVLTGDVAREVHNCIQVY
ncbi:transposase, partial [Thiolapillus sp.]